MGLISRQVISIKRHSRGKGGTLNSLDTFTPPETPRGVSSPQPDATGWKPWGARKQRKP